MCIRDSDHGLPTTPHTATDRSLEVSRAAEAVCSRQHRRDQAESSVRPLPRRAARIARPARVRMRSRKPWVLARRRLFGWKVRLVTSFSNGGEGHLRSPGDAGPVSYTHLRAHETVLDLV